MPPAFREVTAEEHGKGSDADAVVIGNYVIAAEAVRKFEKTDKLAIVLKEIRAQDKKPPQGSRADAELSTRQLLNIYLDEAAAFYHGKGRRGTGEVAKRREGLTDLALGDEYLGRALTQVKYASRWEVPLDKQQVQQLNEVITKRLTQ